jgi:hypothetical protein
LCSPPFISGTVQILLAHPFGQVRPFTKLPIQISIFDNIMVSAYVLSSIVYTLGLLVTVNGKSNKLVLPTCG